MNKMISGRTRRKLERNAKMLEKTAKMRKRQMELLLKRSAKQMQRISKQSKKFTRHLMKQQKGNWQNVKNWSADKMEAWTDWVTGMRRALGGNMRRIHAR